MRPSIAEPETIARDIENILRSRTLTKGPVVNAYESAVRGYLGVRNVVATANATIGLALTFKALRLEGPVIVPSYTFMATAHALTWAGATPVFADVDPLGWTLDPNSARSLLTPQVQAIVAVPIFGNPCDIEALQGIADGARIPLVFDSAHGIGSSHGAVPLGGNGRTEVFSTSPTKTLTTSEGGLVSTNDDELAARLRMLVEYGNDGTFDSVAPGLNGRLSEVHAAIGLRNLEVIDQTLSKRWALVDVYRSRLDGERALSLQVIRRGDRSSYKDFTVLIEDDFGMSRDEISHRLRAEFGIETKRYFSPAVHRQRPYRKSIAAPLPVTERLERQALSLPLWSDLATSDVEFVCESLLGLRKGP